MRAALCLWSLTPTLARGEETRAAGDELPLLEGIRQIRALSAEEAERGHPVRVRGVVTHFDQRAQANLIIHDGRAGLRIVSPSAASALPDLATLTPGDKIEVEGATARGSSGADVRAGAIRRLGRGPLPPARRFPYSTLLSGLHDCEYAEVSGVGQRAWLTAPEGSGLVLELAVEGGPVRVVFWRYAAHDLERFIDARVRLRGNVGTFVSPAEQLRGVTLFAGRTSDVVVERPAPEPFNLPLRAINSLGQYSLAADSDRRVHVQGVVVQQQIDRPLEVHDSSSGLTFDQPQHVLYVQDGTGSLRAEVAQGARLERGERLDVAGFPVVTPTKPMLRAAVFRRLGAGPEPEPQPLAPALALSPDHDAELVRIEGALLGQVTHARERVLVVKRDELVFDAVIDPAIAGTELDALREGSRVSVAGVYVFQWGPPPSFRILLRSPGDVTLVRQAPWWTFRHTQVLLGILCVLAVAGALWAKTIANKNALIRQQYRGILDERSRLARELHDTLEQGLAGITLQLEAVSGNLETSAPAAQASLDVARQMLRYCLDEARRSVMDLRSQALDANDLPAALKEMAQQMTVGSKVRAEVLVTGTPRRLDTSEEHHLLRIGLEALTNALKHSGASVIEIALDFKDDATELVVRDDGRGFPPARDDMPGGHFGLHGIRERVDKLGGSLRLDQRAGGGAEIAVCIPWRPAAATTEAMTEDA